MSKNPVINVKNIDINNLVITKPEENDRCIGQKIAYIRYKSKNSLSQLYFKTPPILMSYGGIPSECSFYPDDKARAKGFKIPFNQLSEDEILYYKKCEELDEYFNSVKFKKEVMGFTDKTIDSYEYQKIIKIPGTNDDDDDNNNLKKKNNYPKPLYMKAFFDLDYFSDEVKVKIIHKNKDVKTPVTVKTLNDALEYIKFMGTNRYILTPNKFYVAKSKDASGKKKYGLTFKIILIEAEPPIKNNTKLNLSDDLFISDDEDDDDDDDKNLHEDFNIMKTENIIPKSVKIEDFKNYNENKDNDSIIADANKTEIEIEDNDNEDYDNEIEDNEIDNNGNNDGIIVDIDNKELLENHEKKTETEIEMKAKIETETEIETEIKKTKAKKDKLRSKAIKA